MTFRPLYLAFHYLKFNAQKFWILTVCGMLTILLPLLTFQVFGKIDTLLTERASRYPLVVGGEGSAMGLVFHTLFYATEISKRIEYGTLEKIKSLQEENNLGGYIIPFLSGYKAENTQIIGVNADFFDFAKLPFQEGAPPSLLGDVVLGSAVATKFNLGVGQKVQTDVENLFNVASSFRSKLWISGVLAPTGGPEDHIIFTDIKTTWLLEGLYHGHQSQKKTVPDQSSSKSIPPPPIENPNGGSQNIPPPHIGDANAESDGNNQLQIGVPEYVEVTDENRSSFHAHGDPKGFPVTAFLVIPDSDKTKAILHGLNLEEGLQAVYPEEVVKEVLHLILGVQQVLSFYFSIVILTVLLLFFLILVFSLKLRASELQTMKRMGCSRGMIFMVIASEYGIIFCSSVLGAVLLSSLGVYALQSLGYAYLL